MKKALYEIRVFPDQATYSVAFSPKLVSYKRAIKVVKFLRARRGMDCVAMRHEIEVAA
jgi:hypothetical protein